MCQIRMNLNLPSRLRLKFVPKQFFLAQNLQHNHQLRRPLARQVHSPKFPSAQWPPNLEILNTPIFWVEIQQVLTPRRWLSFTLLILPSSQVFCMSFGIFLGGVWVRLCWIKLRIVPMEFYEWSRLGIVAASFDFQKILNFWVVENFFLKGAGKKMFLHVEILLAWTGLRGLFWEKVCRCHVGIGLELEEILEVVGLGGWVLVGECGWFEGWLEDWVRFDAGYCVERTGLEGVVVGFGGKVESAHEVAKGRGEAWVGHLGGRVREFGIFFLIF
jgi:hypothetical protein